MNNSNTTYKRLGDYIREVDVRNSEMKVNLSQGICNMKYFQNPRQVSSTPHLDKIVRTGQFAYNRATTRNGNKISIAYREGPDCTVSSAYCVFYITDEEIINPYYLWLWFKRPDFDRYAIFMSHGSAHEFFEFETLCNTYVPIPSIEEQRKIVYNYLAIQKRIETNKQTIAKLEEAAQALYRKMFIDNIDPNNLPPGWRMGTLGEMIDSTLGGDWGKESQEGNYTQLVSCIRGADIKNAKLANFKEAPRRYILEKNLASRQLRNGDIVIEISGGTPTQSTGRSILFSEMLLKRANNSLICSNFCRIIKPQKKYSEYLYSSLKYLYDLDIFFKYENSSNGIQNLDLDAVIKEEIISIPSMAVLDDFSNMYNYLAKEQIILGVENQKLINTLSLLIME